jgi:small subunit ribosomal protein S4
MSRYIGPRNKRARKVGEDLGLKSNSVKVSRRLQIRPGQHGAKNRRKISDFGTQLQEKQKLKYIYGITEKHLRKMYLQASTSDVATGESLLSALERRLDNTVYRLGWAGTRAGARQLVAHGHVHVNGKKLSIPSYQVEVDDVINLSDKIVKMPDIVEKIKEDALVEWVEKKQAVAKILRLPNRSDVKEAIVEQLVVEYYSR